ncbi:MAG: hypothetical protein JSW39_11095, partial [Desulfobacterales bacterium]
NLAIVNHDGALLASGKIINAICNPSMSKQQMQDRAPYSISKLVSMRSAAGKNTWRLVFRHGSLETALDLEGIANDPTPAVVFLISRPGCEKDPVEFDEKQLGRLPILGISQPGKFTLARRASKDIQKICLEADTINKIIF